MIVSLNIREINNVTEEKLGEKIRCYCDNVVNHPEWFTDACIKSMNFHGHLDIKKENKN